jgi:hypothetical protein
VRPHLLLFLIAAFPSPSFAEGGAVVEGRVTESITSAAISGVSVQLTRDGDLEGTYATQTDVAGAFHFDDVPPGDYVASFEKHGYASLFSDVPVTEPVHVASNAVHLQADLAALTTLRGRVLDNSKRPVPEAIVEMSTPQRQTRATVTDSEGRFEFKYLRSGFWLLYAVPSHLPPPEDGRIWTNTWFPDITNRAQATPIRVRGGELAGFDILLRSVQPHKVTGTVLDEHGDPAPDVSLTLREPGWSRDPRIEILSDVEGRFEFRNVLPGNWLGIAETKDEEKRKVITPAFITTGDLDNLRLRLAPPSP